MARNVEIKARIDNVESIMRLFLQCEIERYHSERRSIATAGCSGDRGFPFTRMKVI